MVIMLILVGLTYYIHENVVMPFERGLRGGTLQERLKLKDGFPSMEGAGLNPALYNFTRKRFPRKGTLPSEPESPDKDRAVRPGGAEDVQRSDRDKKVRGACG